MSKKAFIKYVALVIGSVIAAFAVEMILVPGHILDGGIVGVSMIISAVTKFPLGVLTFLLNVPFLVIGFKKMNRDFIVKTVISMAVFSTCLSIFARIDIDITDDLILSLVFGGILLGVGVGLVIKAGGCLDGTETVAILISQRSSMSVGQVVLGFNVIIFLVAGFVFGLDRALYSLLTYFVVSNVEDFFITGLDQGKAVMIITEQGRQIADDIYKELGRTVTFMKGEGLISGEKTVLYCVITRMEISTLRRIIENDDYSAFMTISDVSEIIGKHIKSNKKVLKGEDKRKSDEA